jgi:hypothetical protein
MAHLPPRRLVQLFFVFVSATLAQAAYYMEESDSHINYSVGWNRNHSSDFLDPSKLYGGNW